MICGAVLRVTLEVSEERKIANARFKAAGCSYLVAACSVLTDEVTGKSTAEAAAAARSTNNSVLSDIPFTNQHCLDLGRKAILNAIISYSDSVRAEWRGEDALICTCFGISEDQIERAIEEKQLRTVGEVTTTTKAGGGCGSCYKLIEDILDTTRAREIE